MPSECSLISAGKWWIVLRFSHCWWCCWLWVKPGARRQVAIWKKQCPLLHRTEILTRSEVCTKPLFQLHGIDKCRVLHLSEKWAAVGCRCCLLLFLFSLTLLVPVLYWIFPFWRRGKLSLPSLRAGTFYSTRIASIHRDSWLLYPALLLMAFSGALSPADMPTNSVVCFFVSCPCVILN